VPHDTRSTAPASKGQQRQRYSFVIDALIATAVPPRREYS